MAEQLIASSLIEEISESYLLVDVCCHLTNRKFHKDLDSVVQRAKQSGVQKLITSGNGCEGGKQALRLSRLYPDVIYFMIGFHPLFDSNKWHDDNDSDVRHDVIELLSCDECVGFGCIGLDFSHELSEDSKQRQKQLFSKQMLLLLDSKSPKTIVVHERNAHQEVLEVLLLFRNKGLNNAVVIHSFDGSAEQLQQYIGHGFYISVTGNVWKTDSLARQLLERKAIPVERMLIASDSPFHYCNARANKVPQKVKSSLTSRSLSFLDRYSTFQRNEPSSLPIVCELISALSEHQSAQEMALKTTFNALKLFPMIK